MVLQWLVMKLAPLWKFELHARAWVHSPLSEMKAQRKRVTEQETFNSFHSNYLTLSEEDIAHTGSVDR